MGVWKADEEQKVITTKKQPTRDSIEATLSAVWRLLKSFSVQVIVKFLPSKSREKYVVDKNWNQCKLRKCIRPSTLHRYSKDKGQEAANVYAH
jgi:ribosomal silencing factor RsfS